MNVFAKTQQFGTLKIVNVYFTFDGPKIFYAENETGSTFFVYWVGNNDSHECWFVIPCSKSKLISLEKQKIDLATVFSSQEQEYFYDLKLPLYLDGDVIVGFKHRNKVSEIELPKPGLFVKKVSVFSSSVLDCNLIPTHELVVSKASKKSKKNISLEHISLLCDKFSEFALGFNRSRGIKGNMQALNARYGSFALSIHADDLMSFESFLKKVSSLMIAKKDITSFLKQNDIDIKAFLNLLKAIETSRVDFQLRSSTDDDLIIYKSDAERYLESIKKLALTYISSIKVPQGNDLGKIFKFVELKWQGDIISVESLGVHQRLIDYYKYSALILGFIEFNGALTPQGQRIALSDNETKYKIAANAFESSECGWAWINYCDVTSLSDVNVESAVDFLKECCPSLTGDTVNRRANTLKSWHEQLKPYYDC